MSAPATLSAPVNLATVTAWQAYQDEVTARLGACFRRVETRQQAQAYVQDLLISAPRKNGWQLAEVSGDATLYGLHCWAALCGRPRWWELPCMRMSAIIWGIPKGSSSWRKLGS